ncbi:MAG: hypothetical protein C0620_05550 [Desulfuromonas sp.]|jgi:hypothetical protein|nr:MAG: hypothetical protein C0620_05550 [Desulfuromonas sp.]
MTVMNSLKIVSAAVLMIAVTSLPYTADASSRFRGDNAGTGLYLIDTDGDGVGDTRPEPGTGMGANATNFVDADGDGVCDTYAAGGQQLLDGSGVSEDALQLQTQERIRLRTQTSR